MREEIRTKRVPNIFILMFGFFCHTSLALNLLFFEIDVFLAKYCRYSAAFIYTNYLNGKINFRFNETFIFLRVYCFKVAKCLI